MKTRPDAEELFDVDRQTEGRTDRHKDSNCPFFIFVKAPEII